MPETASSCHGPVIADTMNVVDPGSYNTDIGDIAKQTASRIVHIDDVNKLKLIQNRIP